MQGIFNLKHYYIHFPKAGERAREYEIALLPRPIGAGRRVFQWKNPVSYFGES